MRIHASSTTGEAGFVSAAVATCALPFYTASRPQARERRTEFISTGSQGVNDRQTRRADGGEQAAEQADEQRETDTGEYQTGRDRETEHDLAEIGAQCTDRVAVEKDPREQRADRAAHQRQIGIASCRERVCQSV